MFYRIYLYVHKIIMNHTLVWSWSVLLCLVLCSSESTLLDHTSPPWVPPAFLHLYFLHSDPQTLWDTKTNFWQWRTRGWLNQKTSGVLRTLPQCLYLECLSYTHILLEKLTPVWVSCCERFCLFLIHYDIALVLFSFYMDMSLKRKPTSSL